MDLAGIRDGSLSIRRVARLTFQLPPGSRIWRADISDAAWSDDTYLLADIFDVMQVANWQRQEPGSNKPTPYPRPQSIREDQAKKELTRKRMARFLE